MTKQKLSYAKNKEYERLQHRIRVAKFERAIKTQMDSQNFYNSRFKNDSILELGSKSQNDLNY